MKVITITLLMVIFILFESKPLLGEEPDTNSDSLIEFFEDFTSKSPEEFMLKYSNLRYFKDVEVFGSIEVSTQTDIPEIIKTKELTEYARLRFKNNFANVEFIKTLAKRTGSTDEVLEKTGYIKIIVWTVGEDYPIAYHVKLESGTIRNFKIHEGAYLGYANSFTI